MSRRSVEERINDITNAIDRIRQAEALLEEAEDSGDEQTSNQGFAEDQQ